MTDQNTMQFSCDSALAADEPLDGKGTTGTHWLLVEADTPWPRKAIAEKELAPGVTEKLLEFKNSTEGGRVQFIRGEQDPAEKPRLMLARTDLSDRPLRCLELDRYEDILDLDIKALFDEPVPPEQIHQPVFLVCVNGMRDACCAREGTSCYQALSEVDGQHVFQTTHLGGHRFAANLLWLPYGVLYGRLKPEQAATLLDLAAQKQIMLSNLRGLVNIPHAAQAADRFLRLERDLAGLDDLQFGGLEGESPKWQASFILTDSQETVQVAVEFESAAFQVYKTTGDEEPAMTGRYHCRVI